MGFGTPWETNSLWLGNTEVFVGCGNHKTMEKGDFVKTEGKKYEGVHRTSGWGRKDGNGVSTSVWADVLI